MRSVRFADLDFHVKTIAVAVAEIRGEVRSVGRIPNRFGSVRRLIGKLGKRASLRVAIDSTRVAADMRGIRSAHREH
jgi:hypothetical protein